MEKKVSKKLLLVIGLSILFIIIGLSGCGQQQAPSDEPKASLTKLEIGGTGAGGAYHLTASGLVEIFERELGLDIPMSASVNDGAAEIIRLMDAGRMEAGLVSSDVYYNAWYGNAPFDREYKTPNIVMNSYPNGAGVIALKESGIKNLSDLAGKRVGMGPSPVTWKPIIGLWIAAHGIKVEDFEVPSEYMAHAGLEYKSGPEAKAVFGNWDDLTNQLRDGVIDAVAVPISALEILTGSIVALSTEKELVFLEWDEKVLDNLSEVYPYITKVEVAPGILPGRDKPYKTLSFNSQQLVVRADLPEDIVYNMTKLTHENLQSLAEKIKPLKYTASHPENLTQKMGDVAYHPGAIKYWKEVGLWKE